MIGGAVRAAEHCGLLEAHARRNGVTIFGARIAELGEGAEPMPAHHPVADLEPGDIGANRDHITDCLAAGMKGGSGRNWYFPANIRTSTYCAPRARILTCTSPAPGGGGSGTSRRARTSGPPNASHTTALIPRVPIRPLRLGQASRVPIAASL